VPITETIFRPFNLVLVGIVMAAMSLLASRCIRRRASQVAPAAALAEDERSKDDNEDRTRAVTPAMPWSGARSWRSCWAERGSVAFVTVRAKGGAITLNFVNFAFLTRAIAPLAAVVLPARSGGGGGTWGVIVQFPLRGHHGDDAAPGST
jgi:short subunit fatty acids transporter